MASTGSSGRPPTGRCRESRAAECDDCRYTAPLSAGPGGAPGGEAPRSPRRASLQCTLPGKKGTSGRNFPARRRREGGGAQSQAVGAAGPAAAAAGHEGADRRVRRNRGGSDGKRRQNRRPPGAAPCPQGRRGARPRPDMRKRGRRVHPRGKPPPGAGSRQGCGGGVVAGAGDVLRLGREEGGVRDAGALTSGRTAGSKCPRRARWPGTKKEGS